MEKERDPELKGVFILRYFLVFEKEKVVNESRGASCQHVLTYIDKLYLAKKGYQP